MTHPSSGPRPAARTCFSWCSARVRTSALGSRVATIQLRIAAASIFAGGQLDVVGAHSSHRTQTDGQTQSRVQTRNGQKKIASWAKEPS